LLRDLSSSFLKISVHRDGSFRSGFPNGNLAPAVGFGVLVIFKRKHPGPNQSVAAFNNTSQDIKHCLGLATDSILALVVKGTVEAAQIDI